MKQGQEQMNRWLRWLGPRSGPTVLQKIKCEWHWDGAKGQMKVVSEEEVMGGDRGLLCLQPKGLYLTLPSGVSSDHTPVYSFLWSTINQPILLPSLSVTNTNRNKIWSQLRILQNCIMAKVLFSGTLRTGNRSEFSGIFRNLYNNDFSGWGESFAGW